MTIRIVKREYYKTYKTEQLLSGIIGATITTIPAVILIPLWAMFIERYRVTDKEGNDSDSGCVVLGFLAGVWVWWLWLLKLWWGGWLS